MAYEIAVEKLPAQYALVIRARVAPADLSQELARLLPEVFRYALDQQAGVSGMPFTRYLSVSPVEFDIEAGMPVSKAVPGDGRITPVELPAGPAAVLTYFGPYSGLAAAHEAVHAWVREHGKSASDPPWEEYVTDPCEEPDEQKWETRICQPIF